MTWTAVLNTVDQDYTAVWTHETLPATGFGVVQTSHPVAQRGIGSGVLIPVAAGATDPAAVAALQLAFRLETGEVVAPTVRPTLDQRLALLEATDDAFETKTGAQTKATAAQTAAVAAAATDATTKANAAQTAAVAAAATAASGTYATKSVLRQAGVEPRMSMVTADRMRATRATAPLTTPTYDGSGQSTHPSIFYRPGGWNGYKFWMAMTPYPSSQSQFENPSILVSNDGETWIVPPGLTNPIEPTPSGGAYNSDTELAYDEASDTLYCFFRSTENGETIYYKTSTNGVTWSTKVIALNSPGTLADIVSPSIAHDGTQWVMWTVNYQPAGPSSKMQRRTAAALTGPWSSPTDCTGNVPTLTSAGNAQTLWHTTVYRAAGQWHALFLSVVGTGGYILYFATSVDGLAWTCASTQLLPQSPGLWDTNHYRSALVKTEDGYWLYYAGYASPSTFRIGRTRMYEAAWTVSPADDLVVGPAGTTSTAKLHVKAASNDQVAFSVRPGAVPTVAVFQVRSPNDAGAWFEITKDGGVRCVNYAGSRASATGLGVFGDTEMQNSLFVGTSGGTLRVGATTAPAGSAGTIVLGNGTAPTSNPSSGGVLFAEGGALKWRGSSGTVTTIAPA